MTASFTPKPTEPRTGEPLARLSDHLGRLLAHADRLLAEWQAHADGLRGRFEGEAEAAGQTLARTLEAALAEASRHAAAELQRGLGQNAESLRADLERARKAAADLEAHMKRLAGGAGPTSVDELRAGIQGISAQLRAFSPEGGRRGAAVAAVVLAATANVMLAAVLYVILQKEPAAAPPPEPEPVIAVVEPDAAPPPPPPPPPCGALAVEGVATAARVAAACVAELCPQKLAECRAEGAAGDLVAALRSLERDKVLGKLGCPLPEKDAEGRYAVTVRWLLDCPK